MRRPMPGLLSIAAIAMAAALARPALADPTCVSPKVAEALFDCSAAASLPKVPLSELLVAAPASQAPRGRGLEPRAFDDAEKTRENALHRLTCEGDPAHENAREKAQRAEIELARARIYFEANRFEEATSLFRRVAFDRRDQPFGLYAASLYLEALNQVAASGRPGCYDAMGVDVAGLIDLYCKGAMTAEVGETCDVFSRVRRDVLRRGAEERILRAREGGGGDEDLEAGAELYMLLWSDYGLAACATNEASCDGFDEILTNAARAYQAAHRLPQATVARMALLDPRYHLDRTSLAQVARYELAETFLSIAEFDKAASWYEAFAEVAPKEDRAPDALQDAVILRLALGQVEAAERGVGSFAKQYGTKRAAQAAQLRYAIAASAVDRGDFAQAKRQLIAAMPQIDSRAPVALQIEAHAALGRTLAALGDKSTAAKEYDVVRSLYRDPAAVLASMDATYEGARVRSLGRVLTAVGEARFFFAEQKRDAADAVAPPKTTRSEALAAWVARRSQAIDEAERAYLEVMQISPAPPPKWVVRSAGRVARMHGRLAAQILTMPLKAGRAKAEEATRAAHRKALEEASEPERRKAKAAYRVCVDMAAKYQYADEGSIACADWLSKHYPNEFPRLDELIDAPTRVGDGRLPPLPLRDPRENEGAEPR